VRVHNTHTRARCLDQFSRELVVRVLGKERVGILDDTDCCHSGNLNMTYVALRCSRYINGVAMHHAEISHSMFPNYPVHAITNCVHAATWTSGPFRELYDRHLPEWRDDNLYLRYAIGLPLEEIQQAHVRAKRRRFKSEKRRSAHLYSTARRANPSVATFSLRCTPVASAMERNSSRAIREKAGPFQIILGGKAHPRDEAGKIIIRKVVEAAAALRDSIPVVYVGEQ
jgi:glycogen phosphorylase